MSAAIGWVDFSKSDRDLAHSVLRQLEEPGAVDELGIGTIRDAFSDIFFPGTSTGHTRAKYLFLTPYICLELEREGKSASKEFDFIEKLEQREVELIDVLDVNDAEGVIGKVSKETLKRKPSSLYWNALRTYGFFSALRPITLSQYVEEFWKRKRAADLQKSSGRQRGDARDEDEPSDDVDVGRSGTAFWRVISPADWRDGLNIGLKADEADFLREKILSMPKTKNSLFALILREKRRDFINFGDFGEIDALLSVMPDDMRRDYELARDFSRFVFGAQVRYNVIFSEGKNELAKEWWEEYMETRPTVNLSDVQKRLQERLRWSPKPKLMRFLEQFQHTLGNIGELDSLIKGREIALKGRARAKLTNKETYKYNAEQSVDINMRPLTYRMPVAQRFVRDIFEGSKNA